MTTSPDTPDTGAPANGGSDPDAAQARLMDAVTSLFGGPPHGLAARVAPAITAPTQMLALKTFNSAADRLATADSNDVQSIAASQVEMLKGFYVEVIDQSKRSFTLALWAAGVGLAFFLVAIGGLLLHAANSSELALISGIAGAIVQVFTGMLLTMVRSARKQLSDYYVRLDMTQRYLLGNSITEPLTEPSRTDVRVELVRTIAEIAQAKATAPAAA
jgi:Cyanobacterial TRADD-N associated 2-Transmembrane domain